MLTALVTAPSAINITALADTAQSKSFDAIGYVQIVDPDHNRITFERGSVTYVVNTVHSAIHVPALGSTQAETGDLVSGMRVEVTGTRAGSTVVVASKLLVLPYIPPTEEVASQPTPQAPPRLVQPSIVSTNQADDSRLPSDQSGLSAQPLPPVVVPAAVDQIITGVVSAEASFFSRDIKITTPFGDMKVNVPRGVDIEIDGRSSSVHDLKKNMTVEIYGTPQPGNSFHADKILSTDSDYGG